jgi:hypothetical protein
MSDAQINSAALQTAQLQSERLRIGRSHSPGNRWLFRMGKQGR